MKTPNQIACADQSATHHVQPLPVSRIRPCNDCKRGEQHGRTAPPKQRQCPPAAPRARNRREPPNPRIELRIDHQRDRHAVDGKRDIVGLDCRLRLAGMPTRVLRPHHGGVKEDQIVNRVGCHAKNIEEDKINGEAARSLAAVVEDGLGIEGGGPA